MDAPHLLLELLDDGVQLQVIDGQLRAEFPPGRRTPGRAEAIRAERDGLIDLASRSPAGILATLRRAGIIVSVEGDRIRVDRNVSGLTPDQRAAGYLSPQFVDEVISMEPNHGALLGSQG